MAIHPTQGLIFEGVSYLESEVSPAASPNKEKLYDATNTPQSSNSLSSSPVKQRQTSGLKFDPASIFTLALHQGNSNRTLSSSPVKRREITSENQQSISIRYNTPLENTTLFKLDENVEFVNITGNWPGEEPATIENSVDKMDVIFEMDDI